MQDVADGQVRGFCDGVAARAGLRRAVLCAAVLLCACGGSPPQAGPLDVETQWGEVGSSPGQLSYPRAIDCDETSLWVVDKTARVQRLDPLTGECVGGWRMPEWELGKPTGVTVWRPREGEEELVFVADTHYHRVRVYKAKSQMANGKWQRGEGADPRKEAGELMASFGSYGMEAGQFIYPTDVAVLPTKDGMGIERVYVGEYGGNDRITVYAGPREPFEAGGTYTLVKTIGSFGNGASAEKVEFSRPQAIEIDEAARELVVADSCNHRIGRLTLEGELIAWMGEPGGGVGQLNYPYGLALAGDGTALVVEFGNHRVQRFDLASGKSVGVYGEPGRGNGQVSTPWGVAVLDGRAYLLDSGNNRVVGFKVGGRF